MGIGRHLLLSSGLVFLACLAGLVVGCAKNEEGSGGPKGPPKVGYIVVSSQPADFTQTLPARLSAYRVAEIRPRTGGILEKKLFQEGQLVREGQVLFLIDSSSTKAELARTQALVSQAQANLEGVKLRTDRIVKLFEEKAVSTQERDDALSALKQAEANLGVQRALMRSAQINEGYTSITSPITGRTGKTTVTEGTLLLANQPQALVTVQDMSKLYVEITQSSAQVMALKKSYQDGAIKAPDSVDIELLLEDGSVAGRSGKLIFTDMAVDPATGMVAMRGVIGNPDGQLFPGQMVKARLLKGSQSSAIMVPQPTIVRDPKGNPFVFVVEGDKAVKKEVVLGDMAGSLWHVVSGLKAGDKLITEGFLRLKSDTKVKAAPAGQKPADASKSNQKANAQ
jgi:membrane fusion protein, multidrug efflux system